MAETVQIKTFRFYNDVSYSHCSKIIDTNQLWCDTKIVIIEKTYDNGKQYFDIDYSFTYCSEVQNDEHLQEMCNPLLLMKGTTDGEIIVKNSFTVELIRYLMMDYDELREFTGNSTPQDYKMRLMHTIQDFWD